MDPNQTQRPQEERKNSFLSQGINTANQARSIKPLIRGLRLASIAARGVALFANPTTLIIAVIGFIAIVTFIIVLSGGSSFPGIGPEVVDNSDSSSSPAEF